MTPTHTLVLNYLATLSGPVVELRQIELAAELGQPPSRIKHVFHDLIERGVLELLEQGRAHTPSLYRLVMGPPKAKVKRVVRAAVREVREVRIPALVTVGPGPRPDNPVRLVPPGTFAVRGFTMLRGTSRG